MIEIERLSERERRLSDFFPSQTRGRRPSPRTAEAPSNVFDIEY